MGKRKQHDATYFICDWSGIPMKNSNCYLPTWNADNKLSKKGSYCNWESVLAHARSLELQEIDRITEYVHTQMGDSTPHTEAPDYKELEHFGGALTTTQYHDACCYQTNEVFAVKINEAGSFFNVLLDTNNGVVDFSDTLKKPPMVDANAKPSKFQSYHKGKSKDKDLCVFYYPDRNGCELNKLASSLFKMQIYGDALLLTSSKECSFMPRSRYVSYTACDFEDSFLKKRKRATHESVPIESHDYSKMKAEMQASFACFEAQSSSSALPPSEDVKVAKVPAPDGRQIAKLARHQKVTLARSKGGYEKSSPFA